MKNLRAFHVLAFLGIVAAITVIIGLRTLTNQMNDAQRHNESKLVSSQLQSSLLAAAKSVTVMAASDDAIVHLDHIQDKDWANRTFKTGRSTVIWPYTMAYNGEVISGRHYSEKASFKFENALDSQIHDLTNVLGGSQSHKAPAVKSDFFWSEKKLYLIVVSTFTSPSQIKLLHRRAPILAAVTPLRDFLDPHFTGTGIENLIVENALKKNEMGIPLLNHRGQEIAQLAWMPTRPGEVLWEAISPPLIFFMLIFILIVVIAHRHAVIAAKRLVTSEDRSHYLAFHDQLTDLANRRYFIDHFTSSFRNSCKLGRDLSILLVDLDGFKSVNDTYGHPAGDILIKEMANRLREACGSNDFCSRLGGDEFVIVATGRNHTRAVELAEDILALLRKPVKLASDEIKIACSIGIGVLNNHSNNEELMKEADLALYCAKNNGRGRFCLFQPV